MPLALTHRWTATLSINDYLQAEDDGSVPAANATMLVGPFQANGTIGDGPHGATTGDFDAFHVFMASGDTISVDLDAAVFGSTLDATVTIYSPGFFVTATSTSDAFGGADPYIEFTATTTGVHTIVVGAAGKSLSSPFDSASGSGVGSVGDYRLLIGFNGPTMHSVRHGTDGAESIATGEGMVIVGNGGDDTLNGSVNVDLFVWNDGDGNDLVDGHDRDDTQEVNAGNNSETFNLAKFFASNALFMSGGAGGNAQLLLASIEKFDLRARGGDDTFSVENLTAPTSTPLIGAIRYWGGSGNDKLLAAGAVNAFTALGEAGNDTLRSGSGLDVLDGGIGNDLLAGGGAADTLSGGKGRDIFDFNAIADSTVNVRGRDTIIDFRRSQHDRIDLRTIDADQRAANPGNDAFTFIGTQSFAAYHAAHPTVFGMVRFSGGALQANVNANMAADFSVALPGVVAMAGSDLML